MVNTYFSTKIGISLLHSFRVLQTSGRTTADDTTIALLTQPSGANKCMRKLVTELSIEQLRLLWERKLPGTNKLLYIKRIHVSTCNSNPTWMFVEVYMNMNEIRVKTMAILVFEISKILNCNCANRRHLYSCVSIWAFLCVLNSNMGSEYPLLRYQG